MPSVVALLTAILLGSSLRSGAQPTPAQCRREQSVHAAVAAAYKAYLRAWKEKDYAALSQLLSDNYQAVNFEGIVSTKTNEISTAREDRDYDTLTGNIMSVTVFANSAIVSGLIEASWKDEQGKTQQITLRFLAMLQKQKGEWKLAATQSARLNKPAER